MRKMRIEDSMLPPVVDIDGFAQVTAVAIIALAGISVDLLGLAVTFPGKLLGKVISYVAGIMVLDRKATCVRIAEYLGGLSHDQLTRMLGKDKWKCSRLMIRMIRLVQRFGVKGVLIIDDTLLNHPRSKKMKGVYWDWDHAEGRYVFGQRLVMVIWTDGFWRIPVAFAFWHKKGARPKYKTKNEIARALLQWVVHKGIRPEYVTFDNWYASKENIRMIVEQMGLEFATRVKKNTRLIYNGRKLQARTIGSRLLKDARPYRIRSCGTWARKAVVEVPGMGLMTFVVARDVIDGEKRPVTRYLLSSTPRMSAREVVLRYKQRWTIEVFFHDLKQHLRIKDHQGRSLVAANHHVACACLAAVVLDHIRLGTNMTPGETKQLIQRLVFIDTSKEKFRLAILRPAPADILTEIDEAKKALRRQFFRVTGYRIRRPVSPLAA